jgi:hypothetical protein
MNQSNPSFPTFVKDLKLNSRLWTGDTLRLGVYYRLLCLASECKPYGYLADGDSPYNLASISAMTCLSDEGQLLSAVQELQHIRAIGRDAKGRLYVPYLVQHEKKKRVAQKNGKKGGNPNLRNNQKNLLGDNPRLNDRPGLQPQHHPHHQQKIPPKSPVENQTGEVPWTQRLAGFASSGLWMPEWGPKPNEAGCLAPNDLLQAHAGK